MGSLDVVLFPEGGWDTHHHIFETQVFAYSPDRHLTPPEATITQYETFKQSLGITKSVLTHGLSYGNDYSSLKYFIKTLGCERTRGCAVIDEQTRDEEMKDLASYGVRGIRLNLYAYKAMNDVEKQIHGIKLYADRVREKGWFLEFLQTNPANWATLSKVIPTISVPVPGFADILALLKTGNFWIKLSAPYRSSVRSPYYEDMKPLVLALVEANPRRVLWGSDWPHTPNMKVRSREEALKETPFQNIDERVWLTSLLLWLSNEQWRLLMLQNPEELYAS